MKTFKDNDGRQWVAHIDTNALKRVRDMVGCNLGDRAKIVDTFTRLHSDFLFVAEVAYAVIQPEADKRKIDAEPFFAAMAGDVLKGASEALSDAMIDFFPSPELRGVIQQIVAATRNETARAIDGLRKSTTEPTSSDGVTNSPA